MVEIIDRDRVAAKLNQYLQGELNLAALVAWAEEAMMEAEFEETYFEEIKEIVSRLGLADTKAFGLSWEDCQRFLHELGYVATVSIDPIV